MKNETQNPIVDATVASTPASETAPATNIVNNGVSEKTFRIVARNAHQTDEVNRTVFSLNVLSPIKMINANTDVVEDTRLVYFGWFDVVRLLALKAGFATIQNALYGRKPDGKIDETRPSDLVKELIADATLTVSQQEVVVGQIPVSPVTGREEEKPVERHSIRTYLHDLELGEDGLELWEEIKALAKEERKSRIKFN